MELVHTSTYDDDLKRLAKLGATDVEIWEMENIIAAGPEAGDLIPDSGGLRKVRFGFGGKGKRGGGRTIYYVLTQDRLIFLLTAYAKVDRKDLTAKDRKMFKALIKELTDD
jgi:hypothetical protein